jgi:hypothetical protein
VFQDSADSFLRHLAVALTTRTEPSTFVLHALMVVPPSAAYPSPAVSATQSTSPAMSGAMRFRLPAIRFLLVGGL